MDEEGVGMEMKPKTFKDLENEFNRNVKELQKKCLHKRSKWYEHYWAIWRSSGYEVRVCFRCRKKLEEKPTAEERKKEHDRMIAEHECEMKQWGKRRRKTK